MTNEKWDKVKFGVGIVCGIIVGSAMVLLGDSLGYFNP